MADEKKEFDLEDILSEVTGTPAPEPVSQTKPVFQLNLDLDSEYGDIPELSPVEEPVLAVADDLEEAPMHQEEPVHKSKKKRSSGSGCLKGLIYAIVVLALSGALAYFVVMGGLDFTGMMREDVTVDITVPAGASTQEIAALLKENGLIDQELIFRVYSKLTKADGKWQPGEFSLRPDMGYQVLVEELQTAPVRETVQVTIPEGFTIDQIADRRRILSCHPRRGLP